MRAECWLGLPNGRCQSEFGGWLMAWVKPRALSSTIFALLGSARNRVCSEAPAPTRQAHTVPHSARWPGPACSITTSSLAYSSTTAGTVANGPASWVGPSTLYLHFPAWHAQPLNTNEISYFYPYRQTWNGRSVSDQAELCKKDSFGNFPSFLLSQRMESVFLLPYLELCIAANPWVMWRREVIECFLPLLWSAELWLRKIRAHNLQDKCLILHSSMDSLLSYGRWGRYTYIYIYS